MDRTFAGYLKALRVPAGAPQEGRVEWNKKDLFEGETRISIHWTEDSLSVAGVSPEGSWDIQACRTHDGWALDKATQNVKGGTLLAKLRWAGKRIEEAALGAMPSTNWDIPKKGVRRRIKP